MKECDFKYSIVFLSWEIILKMKLVLRYKTISLSIYWLTFTFSAQIFYSVCDVGIVSVFFFNICLHRNHNVLLHLFLKTTA